MANGNEYEKGEKKKILLEEFYKPPQETMEFIYSVYDKFIKWRSLREQPYKQFNNTTLQTYLDDSRKKFWGYLPINYDTDTPQFFFPETRNQIIAILAKIAGMKMKPSFDGVEGFDIIKATVLKDLFEYWRRGSNKKIANFWQFLYNIINGTVVVFTAYNSKERTVKTITEYDPASGETQYKEEKLDDSEIEDLTVNLEDLYIPKIWEPDIQEQDELIHRVLMKWSDFKNAFKGYSQENPVDKFVLLLDIRLPNLGDVQVFEVYGEVLDFTVIQFFFLVLGLSACRVIFCYGLHGSLLRIVRRENNHRPVYYVVQELPEVRYLLVRTPSPIFEQVLKNSGLYNIKTLNPIEGGLHLHPRYLR